MSAALISCIPKKNHDVIESRGICTDFFLSSNMCAFLSCVSISIFKILLLFYNVVFVVGIFRLVCNRTPANNDSRLCYLLLTQTI